jgi:hypothetical protein
LAPIRAASAVPQGCVYSQSAEELGASSDEGIEEFRGLRFFANNEEFGLAAIVMELSQLLGINAVLGIYDDTRTCGGNAKAISKGFLVAANAPNTVEGTVAIGTKLLGKLKEFDNQTAAIAAVCSHEFGHLLQFKYLDAEINKITLEEGSVVRAELFADFICGYYAGVRKLRQDDYPAVIQALNQFRAGGRTFGPQHHGTSQERGQAVTAGIQVGSAPDIEPRALAEMALSYVKSLRLETGRPESACK